MAVLGITGAAFGQYILPSLLTLGGSVLGGIGQAGLGQKQIESQEREGNLNRRTNLFNTNMDQAFAKFLNEQDQAKAKRLRSSLIAALRDAMVLSGGQRTVSPITPEPRAPQPQQVAQQTNQVAQTLFGG